MSEDATSQPSDQMTDTTSATEDNQAQQMLAVAATQTAADQADTSDTATSTQPDPAKADEDKLGDNGRRALTSERQARRAAEKEAKTLRERLTAFEDGQKSELQRAQEEAKRYESELTSTRVANARLMAAVTHDLPPDLIDLLGNGTDEEIDARAKLLSEKLAAAAPPPAGSETKPSPAATRPVESLTPGGKPASAEPEDPNAWIRRMAGRAT